MERDRSEVVILYPAQHTRETMLPLHSRMLSRKKYIAQMRKHNLSEPFQKRAAMRCASGTTPARTHIKQPPGRSAPLPVFPQVVARWHHPAWGASSASSHPLAIIMALLTRQPRAS